MQNIKTKILDEKEIKQKIKRLAYQILEEYIDQEEIYVFGINNNGNKLKDEILNEIKRIKPKFKTQSYSIRLSPADPLGNPITTDVEIKKLSEKHLLIIDDVASTGRTLYYALSIFNTIVPKSIKVGVLVNRKHKSFPIKVDFVGRSLATTVNENILVFMNTETEWHATIH